MPRALWSVDWSEACRVPRAFDVTSGYCALPEGLRTLQHKKRKNHYCLEC